MKNFRICFRVRTPDGNEASKTMVVRTANFEDARSIGLLVKEINDCEVDYIDYIDKGE